MTPSRLLLPFSWLYGAVVIVRNVFFDLGIARTTKVSVPVVSIGNISAGGTGKTPFVLLLAGLLKQMGKRTAVLSRGYGRRSHGFQVVSNGRQKCAEGSSAGDEPALIAEKLQGVPVVVDEKRVRGAQKTIELFSPDVIILDDGFQHRSLRRDCDVVLLTAEELIKPSFLLPAGYRREPFSSLNRADMIVITKCRDTDHFREAAEKLPGRFRAPVFGLRTAVVGIRRLGSGAEAGPESLRGKKIVAFSGIADATSFDLTLAELGANVLAHHRFKDHHWYTSGDLQRIKESFQALRADSLVTTEKDMVRIADTPDSLGQLPLFSIGIRSEMIAGEKELKKILGEIVSKRGT